MILDEIVAHKQRELEIVRRNMPEDDLRAAAREAPTPLNFTAALNTRGKGTRIIAEIKRASPSRGDIQIDLDPAGLALAYARGGAAAVSVLTESRFFRGGLEDLRSVRKAVSIPVLRKDFILEPYQVVESRAMGADSLLLIAACLDGYLLHELLACSRKWGMEPLVEVHDRKELALALGAGAQVIGINNRNLRTFSTDIAVSLSLARSIPPDRVAVSESGIHSREQILRLEAAGYHAFLVGEALSGDEHPEEKLKALRQEKCV
ncbi:MAG: indole-3-glycerol phosphate synthase TrpC [Deltaproteobacteria bacterium]|nr:indole-3-glycerol phosphate synthase TrpC [Deltaproteobacteria bacterium]